MLGLIYRKRSRNRKRYAPARSDAWATREKTRVPALLALMDFGLDRLEAEARLKGATFEARNGVGIWRTGPFEVLVRYNGAGWYGHAFFVGEGW